MKVCAALVVITSALCAGEGGDLFSAIRQGDHAAVSRLYAQSPDPGALLQAVLTSDAKMVKLLLAKGADVNARHGSSGVTVLHAAAFSPELTRILLAAGADANAATTSGHTPLFGAVVRGGSSPVLQLLLDKGANVNALRGGAAKRPALATAVTSADPAALGLLMQRGADTKLLGPLGRMPLQSTKADCLRPLLAHGFQPTVQNVADAAAAASFEVMKLLVERGAPVNGQDPRGYTPLMRAVLSYAQNQEAVAYLLAKGADTAPKSETGDTALSMARRFGNTPIVEILKAARAPDADTAVVVPPAVRDNSVQAAIERGVPLLQKIGAPIFKRQGCVSCHNNTQPATVAAMAKRRGFAVDEEALQRELKSMAAANRGARDQLMTGVNIPEIESYVLLALHEAGEPASAATDLSVHQLAFRQEPDGSWRVDDYRPPQEYSEISGTALAAHGLQRYAPPGRAAEIKERVARARAWLMAARPHGTEEQAMHLLGLAWTKAPARAISNAAAALLGSQHADGGWAQLPRLEPDAYATGLALYALHRGAGMPASHAAYQRGVRHLLDTQRPDGSWFVQTRSYPFQPYFESGFPYGHSQWISAAGSSWALQALLLTVPETQTLRATKPDRRTPFAGARPTAVGTGQE
jgi:hypothetical protein